MAGRWSRLAGELQNCGEGGLEGCSQAQVGLGLVWSVPWDLLQGRARAHERWMGWALPSNGKVGIRRTHLRLRRSISRAQIRGVETVLDT